MYCSPNDDWDDCHNKNTKTRVGLNETNTFMYVLTSEMGQYLVPESAGFPGLEIGIIMVCFQMAWLLRWLSERLKR